MSANKNYKEQQRLSVINLLGEIPNFIALTASLVATRSLVVFMDLIDTGTNLLRTLFMIGISHKLRKDLRYEYNYGVGKVESMVSLFCDMVMIISLMCMLVLSVHDIIIPQHPSGLLIFVVGLKAIGVVGDTYMFIKQKKLCALSGSPVFKSELSVKIKNLAFDSVTLIAILLVYCFRDFPPAWYFSPIVCIAIGVWLMVETIKRIRQSVNELLDKTADEEIQKVIMKALTSAFDKYEGFENVQSRISGGVVYIDLEVNFAEDTDYRYIKQFVNSVYVIIHDQIPECEVSVKIKNSLPSEIAVESYKTANGLSSELYK